MVNRYVIFKFALAVLLTGWGYLSFAQTGATGRIKVSLNDQWYFARDTSNTITYTNSNSTAGWQTVSLPHTWNAGDVMDDEHSYWRGSGWYKKKFKTDKADPSKQVSLFFKGANQETEVYINGRFAGRHAGGYTAFTIPIINLLKQNGEDNEIAVKVNNSFNENIPPLTADFTFYGGIYRDVYLVSTGAVHFDDPQYGSTGVYLSTPAVTAGSASVDAKVNMVNSAASGSKVEVVTTVYDAGGKPVTQGKSAIKLNAGQSSQVVQHVPPVSNPHLWSPDGPYLYQVVTRIYDARSHALLDEVVNPLGFRWYRFDANEGFFINGKACKLIGTSRHQDFQGLGNALPREIHTRDVELLKQMGGNFLRVSHYPQDAAVLEACDRLGIIASVEIPLVNTITESEAFYNNCRSMVKEMIRQNFNHPSILIWAYMNEILLRPKFDKDKPRQELYYKHVKELAQSLDSICRLEDAARYTMIANHGSFEVYNRTGITSVPMLVGWNLYSGWYGKDITEFPRFMDHAHQVIPSKPMLITEYGADADPRLHADTPVRFDKSGEYAEYYHQIYLSEIQKRSFVSGAAVWNLADFNSNLREESMPHMNNKGLLSWNREPKNVYYFYQASLLQSPFIKIASAFWKLRAGNATSGNDNTSASVIKVYTNADSVKLYVNGRFLGLQKVINHECKWIVPFNDGKNSVKATATVNGRVYEDYTEINFKVQPFNLKSAVNPFTSINILLGSKRYYIDETGGQVWQPDQPYQKGSWGYVGGTPYGVYNGRQSYGSDKAISGTNDDPVFQTQRSGIKAYRLDVPDGQYEITLDFAELTGGKVKEALAYNLGGGGQAEQNADRVFDVIINNQPILTNFNIREQYGAARSVSKKAIVTVTGNEGINIQFGAKKGEPVLNALQVVKIF